MSCIGAASTDCRCCEVSFQPFEAQNQSNVAVVAVAPCSVHNRSVERAATPV